MRIAETTRTPETIHEPRASCPGKRWTPVDEIPPPEKHQAANADPDRTVTILGVRITDVTFSRAVEILESQIRESTKCQGEARSIYFVNAHTLNLAVDRPSYRDVLNSATHVLGDGTGVRWAARWQGIRLHDNLVGTDLVPSLFERTANRGYSYFLLGADARSIGVAAEAARARFPGWKQAGFHHGFVKNPADNAAALAAINAARPDVLLVGMGNPLQEEWIHRHRAGLNVACCLGVGGLFDHWAGNIQRAPRWLRWLGHEWLGLMIQQPHKARRYLIGNPLFLARMLKDGRRPAPATACREDRRAGSV